MIYRNTRFGLRPSHNPCIIKTQIAIRVIAAGILEVTMYKVLLVDDEPLIREAISENTNWSELGYELIGTAKNGKEAIEVIKKSPPDLLLTDICMPYVDGVELTKYVHETFPETKVVIISGYDEFEYAKMAVRYQVMEYILKPITAKELSGTLQKVKEKLDDERKKERNMQKIRGAYISNLPLMRGRFLNSFMQKGTLEDRIIKERLKEYEIEFSDTRFMSAIIIGDSFSKFLSNEEGAGHGLAHFAIYNIAEESMREYGYGVTFQDIEERTFLIFNGGKGMERNCISVCEEIQALIFKYTQIECTIGIGQSVDNISKLYYSFEDAKRALEYKFLLGGNQVIYANSLVQRFGESEVDVSAYAGELALAIKTGDKNEIRRGILAFLQQIREAYLSKNRSIFCVQNLILSLMSSLGDSVLSENNIFMAERDLLNEIYTKNQLAEVAENLIDFCNEIARSMHDQKDTYMKKQALLALDYIEKNYGDSGISLNTVCTRLAMSTSYFSSIFKAYTGETFIEALTKKRIEKAENLMEHSAKKTYEIADEVGYSDPHYFSSTFKKVTGMTPTEYAKKVRQL